MVRVQLQLKTQGKARVVLNPRATEGQVWWKNIPEDSCLPGGRPALHTQAAPPGRVFVGKVACGRGSQLSAHLGSIPKALKAWSPHLPPVSSASLALAGSAPSLLAFS